MTLSEAIARADAILPGQPVDVGDDPRWQAIIQIGEYVATHPDQVWNFAHHWGSHEQLDLRQAVATCLLEHLLAHHFEYLFPKVEAASQTLHLLCRHVLPLLHVRAISGACQFSPIRATQSMVHQHDA